VRTITLCTWSSVSGGNNVVSLGAKEILKFNFSFDLKAIRSLVTASEEENNPIIGTWIGHTTTSAKYHCPNLWYISGIVAI